MKRLALAAFALVLWIVPAAALLCPSVPNTFSNGTTADANQVNANFAALLTCFNTVTAKNGSNSDITGLSGLSTPPSGTGSLVFWGGTAGGTASAVVVASTNPTGFALTTGNIVSFVASAAPTGATTLAVNGTTAKAVKKIDYTGIAALGPNDYGIGQTVSAVYDGTQYVVISNIAPPAPVVLPSGRLTLTTGVPVLSATVSAATTIFYTPYQGAGVPLWNGAAFNYTAFSEVSQLLSDVTKSPAAALAASVYDMFVWSDAGTIRVSRGPAWTNTTTRSAGTAVARVSGVLVNSISITNGPAAGFGTYVGTIATDAGGATVTFNQFGSGAGGPTNGVWVGLWNQYNRIYLTAVEQDTTNSWAYATAVFRASDGSNNNRITTVTGQIEDSINVLFSDTVLSNGPHIAVGVDSTSSSSGNASSILAGATSTNNTANYAGLTQLGVHFYQALERANGSSTTFFGQGPTIGQAYELVAQTRY